MGTTTIPRRSPGRSCARRSAGCATAVPFAEDVRAELAEVLPEAGVLSPSLAPSERVPARIVSRGCCRRAYVRGAFIGCGSLSRPRSEAHLEWRVSSDAAALQLQELAEVEGFALGVHETRR